MGGGGSVTTTLTHNKIGQMYVWKSGFVEMCNAGLT